MTFENWLQELDLLCWTNYGMSIHDLPDMETRDAFDDGISPLQFFHDELGTVDDLARVMI